MANTRSDVQRLIKKLEMLGVKVQDKAMHKLVGDQAVKMVYKRVKSGRGVTSLASKSPGLKGLTGLSKGYIKQRRRTGVPGKDGSPSKSNLTYTGQMLEALSFEVSKYGFEILVKDTIRRAKGGVRAGVGMSNSKVAKYTQEQRPWLSFSKSEQKDLSEMYRGEFRKAIKKLFN